MPLPLLEPLHSSRLTIRPVREADLADLLEINGDPAVTGFLPYATWQSLDDGRAWLARMDTLAQAGTSRQLVLSLDQAQKVVGTLLLFRYDEGSSRAEVGYVLGRRYWQQGLMREALETVCTHCFSSPGIRRLEAEVDPANDASNRVLARLGFVREGTLRQRWVGKGRTYDTHLYGLLRDEWQLR